MASSIRAQYIFGHCVEYTQFFPSNVLISVVLILLITLINTKYVIHTFTFCLLHKINLVFGILVILYRNDIIFGRLPNYQTQSCVYGATKWPICIFVRRFGNSTKRLHTRLDLLKMSHRVPDISIIRNSESSDREWFLNFKFEFSDF